MININLKIIRPFDDDWDVSNIDNTLKNILVLSSLKYTKTLEQILNNDTNLNVFIDDKNAETGIVYKNEKIITKLPLSSEHIIGISVDFSGDYQIIITSNANIYTSINGGEHWQLGGISSQLSQLLIPLKTLKTSSKFKSDFYVLSVEHLIKLHIKENGAIQIEEIPNKNNIISFDIISPDRLVCLGNNKIYLCINNVMFYLYDVPSSDFDFDKILYNENKIYVYNNFGITGGPRMVG